MGVGVGGIGSWSWSTNGSENVLYIIHTLVTIMIVRARYIRMYVCCSIHSIL